MTTQDFFFQDPKLTEQLNRYYQVWRETDRVYEEWAKTHGLSFNSVMVLYALYENGDTCTQKQICQQWCLSKQTVHMILKDFEKQGLLYLTPMDTDKRSKYVRLTEEGQKFAGHIITSLHRRELFVMRTMGEDRMKQLNEAMALFAELFQKEVSPLP